MSVDVGRKISTPIAAVVDVPNLPIGIGKEGIWWGVPDAMCGIVPVKAMVNTEDMDDSDSSTTSSRSFRSSRSMMEAKSNSANADLMHITGQSVVSLYLCQNRHPKHCRWCHLLGLAKGDLIAAIYDCKSDILLVLFPKIQWVSVVQSTFVRIGLVVLWLMLHHKFFVDKEVVVQFPDCYKSTLKRQFQASGVLGNYNALNVYNIASWSQTIIPVTAAHLWRPKHRPSTSTSAEAESEDTGPAPKTSKRENPFV